MHRMWYLSEEMPIWSYQYHQPADELGDPGHPSVFGEQFQVASSADAPPGPGARAGRHQRHWQEHGVKDPERQAEAKPGSI